MDSRPRNNQGQFAPEDVGGMDPNTTSAAYNPQIIEARKASLIEKIRRMRGGPGVEESVLQREQMLSAKLRLCELADLSYKPLKIQDEKLIKDGPAKRAAISSGIVGAVGAGIGSLYGAGIHKVITDERINRTGAPVPPKLLKHAAASSRGKYALIGGALGAVPAILQYPLDYAEKKSRADGLKKYPKSKGEIGNPGYTESYPENFAFPTLRAYFRKKEMSAKFFGKMEDEDTALKKASRIAGTAAVGGLAGRVAAWHPVHGGKMNRATIIGAGLGALSQGAFEHIAAAKKGIHGNPMNVTDESRKSTRDVGRALPSAALIAAGIGATIKSRKDETDDAINQVRIRMTGKASESYAAKKHAQARRAMGLEGETFIPKMPKVSLPFAPKSANPKRTADEIGGSIEDKLERLARSAKGTPEGEAAARKLNSLRTKEGKTFMGKVKNAVSKVSSKFKARGIASQKVIGRLLSAKLRLRELARQTYDPYAPKPAEPGQGARDFRNAALGLGALAAGGGVAYASWRGAQAAKSAQQAAQSAQTLTDDALKTSTEARKAARSARVAAARVGRAGKWARTQFTTFPTFKKVASKIFEEDLQNLKELADRSVELNSITYHETNADILRRKARGHREKRDETFGMWPYAVAAPGILAASPALRAESASRVAGLGGKMWKGEHADNTAHLGNKIAKVLKTHPGKIVSALALAPAAVLGGKLAYHTVAARSKDNSVNEELKLANEMRRQRNAEALKK